MKRVRLDPEVCITRTSLENGKRLADAHGLPVDVTLHHHKQIEDGDARPWYRVTAWYADETQHVFTGFSWGYGGEGPRGLEEWAQANQIPLSWNQIATFNNTDEMTVWHWTREVQS